MLKHATLESARLLVAHRGSHGIDPRLAREAILGELEGYILDQSWCTSQAGGVPGSGAARPRRIGVEEYSYLLWTNILSELHYLKF